MLKAIFMILALGTFGCGDSPKVEKKKPVACEHCSCTECKDCDLDGGCKCDKCSCEHEYDNDASSDAHSPDHEPHHDGGCSGGHCG